jgi:hypothetical protein
MANANTPFGLVPKMYSNGTPWNGKANWYYIPVGNANAIFTGDLVTMDGTGSADGKYPTVKRTAAADITIVGVVIGFATSPELGFDINNLTRKYVAASTAMYCLVVDDPNVIFEIQEDSDGGAIAVTALGNNADVVATAGSTTTGQSGMVLDSSDVVTTAQQLRILRLADRPDNALGNYAKWLVMINEHIYRTTVGS